MAAHQGTPDGVRDLASAGTLEPRGTHYTYSEVAAAFKVSIQTVEQWVKRGRIPSPKYIGVTARFDLDALLAMVAGVKPPHTYPVSDSPKASAIRGDKAAKREKQRKARIRIAIGRAKAIETRTTNQTKTTRGRK
jgi:excisionase family DNA binding protein